MKTKIIIIDYSMGNLNSLLKQFNYENIEVSISNKVDEIKNADKIILPGVGHFSQAMKNLKNLNLIDTLNEAILIDKKPVLGICLGMQLMTNYSEEGSVKGLGWINAEVKKFTFKDKLNYKVPHIGWNSISIEKKSPLLKDIPLSSDFYFVHSFFVEMKNEEDSLCTTQYGKLFSSAFSKDNIFGVQFHPEKSHDIGKQLIQNFIAL